jgi:hypothetical protein
MSGKSQLLDEFELFRGNGGGIEGWFSENIPDTVVSVLSDCENHNISLEVLNQLLILSHEGGMTFGFFEFYFLTNPHDRGVYWYDPKKLPEFEERFLGSTAIVSRRQLKWGLKRLYIDGLLYFGNIRQCYRALRSLSKDQLESFFRDRVYDVADFKIRGDYLTLEDITKDDRYLIAEVACKTYAPADESLPSLLEYIWRKPRRDVNALRSKN